MKNLKRMLIWVFAIVCLAGLGLAGCGEKTPNSVTVYAYQYEGDENPTTKVVDARNNLVLSEPENVPEGKEHYGWSTSANWQEGSSDFVIEGNFISLAKVKGVAKNGTVRLYPAYIGKIDYYFVFGLYMKTTTSGIGEEDVTAIRSALVTYLQEEQEATEEELALVDVREYASELGVADVGALVNKKGDVDVIFGLGANIATQAGIEYTARVTGLNVNDASSRVFALLNRDDLSVAVYNWFQGYIQENYMDTFTPVDFVKENRNVTYDLGEHASAEAVVPEAFEIGNGEWITLPEAPIAEEGYVFTGWQFPNQDKSGNPAEIGQAGTRVHVAQDITITALYEQDGFMVSFEVPSTRAAAAPAEKRGLAENEVVELPEAPEAKAGFKFVGWQIGDDADPEHLKAPEETITVTDNVIVKAIYEVDKDVDLTITIGYYTSGGFVAENDPYIASVKTALETYLASVGILNGYDAITYKAYSGNVAPAGALINADLNDEENPINVGVVLGFGVNLKTKGNVEYKARTEDGNLFNMGTATGRYVYRLTDEAISNIVYDWMLTEGSTFATAVVTPAE